MKLLVLFNFNIELKIDLDTNIDLIKMMKEKHHQLKEENQKVKMKDSKDSNILLTKFNLASLDKSLL